MIHDKTADAPMSQTDQLVSLLAGVRALTNGVLETFETACPPQEHGATRAPSELLLACVGLLAVSQKLASLLPRLDAPTAVARAAEGDTAQPPGSLLR